jgi:hypothetical protein
MKKLIILTSLFALIFLSCSKNRTCYRCMAISGGHTYDEKVCTDGRPEDKLPKQDANGNLGWNCTEK